MFHSVFHFILLEPHLLVDTENVQTDLTETFDIRPNSLSQFSFNSKGLPSVSNREYIFNALQEWELFLKQK